MKMIKILPPEEARKIAAGEVIDRPSALVREFLDNAIDAGGKNIEVIIEEGGIGCVEVVDDGSGMGKEDLELCCMAHATSKIRCLEDLNTALSLGFRGEALAAAAAVSRLEICTSDGAEAWKLSTGPGEKGPQKVEASHRVRGTSVRSLGLYDTIPARKRFLKRPGSEAAACRQVFNEKALAFPEISFRCIQDGNLKYFLPPVSSPRERFRQIFLEENEAGFLREIYASGKGFSVSIVAGGPELFRNDRRLQFVFANKRRIQNFALLQAFEYGLQGWFPGGTQPIGAVFVTIDPALADFNIHPAKREARFTDPGAIHHAVSSALRAFARNFSHRVAELAKDTEEEKEQLEMSNEQFLISPSSFLLPTSSFAAEGDVPYLESGGMRFVGRLFGLFIIVEKDDRLFIIDQHAAHERILYERFIKGPVHCQELLVPIPFSTESQEDDDFLEEKLEELERLGIVLRKEQNEWLIEALPAGWALSDRETVAEILKLKNAGANLAEHWLITLSCRRAVKDGDFLDSNSALDLIEELFTLPALRCPHGRPIWFELSRQDLLKTVKRI